MTMTVKLDESLERTLRQRSTELGRSASDLMREALQTYLTRTEPPVPSAFALGQDLFGRYEASANLASQRKSELALIWDQKYPRLATPSGLAGHGKA
jgi:plasmid stability protein